MLSTVYSAALSGVDGALVTVECSAAKGIANLELVGLPDAAVKEAKERVRSACKNSGIPFPLLEILVNLAPANMRKEGSGYDLAILTAILAADGKIPPSAPLGDACFLGELSLSGEVRPILGVLSLATAARDAGLRELYVPTENAAEAAVAEGITVYGVKSIGALIRHFSGEERITPTIYDRSAFSGAVSAYDIDFADVRGQAAAKRAMEIAAAGGHNVLMIGAPGSGKSMLAKRLPTILPDLSFPEAVESTKIHSIAGTLRGNLVTSRPYRAPHHTISPVGLVGGGSNPRPGEISLAHNGVLFLDELPEFSKQLTESLRQPVEDGTVTVTRAMAKVTFPSSFMLVGAMNPCRCGYYGDPNRTCTCREDDVRRYLSRISGPLLDRMDIQITVPSLTFDEMNTPTPDSESSKDIRERVNRARLFAARRFQAAGLPHVYCNAKLSPREVRRFCVPDEGGEAVLRRAFSQLALSGRGHDKILRIARTIADLEESETITAAHIAEAIGYRSLDRKYFGR